MPYNPNQFVTGEKITRDKINSLRITDIIPQAGNIGKYLATNSTGTELAWQTIVAGSSRGLFVKADPSTVVFERTGLGTAIIKAGTIIDVIGTVVTFSASATITMPTLAAGTDYAIWVKSDGTIQASDNHNAAPGAGTWRKIGGFHYAPGGNAVITAGVAPTGGNTTPQINEYSFWDLKFRPACPDPRGMTLVANSFWADIYLTAQNAVTLGLTSAFNANIGDGSSPPLVPVMFGGNGTTINYGGYIWYEAQELASAFGKRCPSQPEFAALAYGITENGGLPSDPNTTGLSGGSFTSRWGVMQSAGCLWVWGNMRGGSYTVSDQWYFIGDGRGAEWYPTVATLLGGSHVEPAYAGSRGSFWNTGPDGSFPNVSSRFVCNHLIAE